MFAFCLRQKYRSAVCGPAPPPPVLQGRAEGADGRPPQSTGAGSAPGPRRGGYYRWYAVRDETRRAAGA